MKKKQTGSSRLSKRSLFHIHLATVYLVFQQTGVRLYIEHAHHVLHDIRLILLYLNFSFILFNY